MTTTANQTQRIDLNADLGEGDVNDAELLQLVSSCSIACGGHAGDEASMRCTVESAIENGVAIGAHPSYPDRDGFGRRGRYLLGDALLVSLAAQIRSLLAIVENNHHELRHVKPHGALYNDAATDLELANIVAQVVKDVDSNMALIGPPDSALQIAAAKAELSYIAEAFVDRAYQDDGRLVSRGDEGAVHKLVARIVAQAVSLATTRTVTTASGGVINVPADTLCIHSDTPCALAGARAIRAALEDQGVMIRATGR
jgi:UPF0271 protein